VAFTGWVFDAHSGLLLLSGYEAILRIAAPAAPARTLIEQVARVASKGH